MLFPITMLHARKMRGINMKKYVISVFSILFFAVMAMMLLIGSSSATDYSYSNPTGLGYSDSVNFIITNNNASNGEIAEITFGTFGTYTKNVRISNCNNCLYGMINSVTGDVWGTDEQGNVFYTTSSSVNYSAGFYSDYNSNPLYKVATLSSTTYTRKLTVDSSGNVYTNDGIIIKKFVKSLDYSSQTIYTLVDSLDYESVRGADIAAISVDSDNNIHLLIFVHGGSGMNYGYANHLVLSSSGTVIKRDTWIQQLSAAPGSVEGGMILDNVNSLSNYTFIYRNLDSGVYLKHNSTSGTVDIGGGALTGITSVSDIGYYNYQVYLLSPSQNLIRTYVTTYEGYQGGSPTVDEVSWSSDTYVAGDMGTYTWIVAGSSWNKLYGFIPYSQRIEIYKNGEIIKAVDVNSQTGTGYFTFDGTGTYKVMLTEYVALPISYFSNELASDSMVVRPAGESQLDVPGGVLKTGVKNTVRVLYGFTPDSEAGVMVYWKDWGGYVLELYAASGLPWGSWSWTSSPAIANTWYNMTFKPAHEGQYKLVLYDFNKGEVVTKYFTAKAVPNPPITNLTASYISVTKTVYSFGDAFSANYGIDNTNFSNGKNYLSIYNWDKGMYTSSYFLVSQIGSTGMIFSSAQSECSADYGCMGLQGYMYAISGNNSLRIVNNTGVDAGNIGVIASVNITINYVDSEGYGLDLSSYKPCTNQKVMAVISSPSNSTLDVYKNGVLKKTYNPTPGQDVSLTFLFIEAGSYELRLISSSNITKRVITVNVADCSSGGAGNGTGGGSGSGNGTGGLFDTAAGEIPGDFIYDIKAFIYSNVGKSKGTLAFLAFIIIGSFAAIFYWLTKHPVGAGIGVLGGIFFTISIGFLDKVAGVVIIVLAGLTFAGMMKKG